MSGIDSMNEDKKDSRQSDDSIRQLGTSRNDGIREDTYNSIHEKPFIIAFEQAELDRVANLHERLADLLRELAQEYCPRDPKNREQHALQGLFNLIAIVAPPISGDLERYKQERIRLYAHRAIDRIEASETLKQTFEFTRRFETNMDSTDKKSDAELEKIEHLGDGQDPNRENIEAYLGVGGWIPSKKLIEAYKRAEEEISNDIDEKQKEYSPIEERNEHVGDEQGLGGTDD